MELYQLQYFKTVAETEHFTRAAELLHISQPSLSKAISNLEAELGVQLFEREKRTVYLSSYGKTFLKRVNRILCEVDEAVREIQDLSGKGAGDVYIGSCAIFSEPTTIAAYTNEIFLANPGIALHCYIMDTAMIEEQLIDHKLDFGYAVTEPANPDISSTQLYSYRLGIVVSRDHPLAKRERIRLSELKEERFLCNNTSPDLRDSVYDLCRRAGFEPHVIFEGESAELIGKAVGQGRGVAFISNDRHRWKQSNPSLANDDIVFLDLEDDFCVRTVYLFQLKDRSLPPAALLFRNGLIHYVERNYPQE